MDRGLNNHRLIDKGRILFPCNQPMAEESEGYTMELKNETVVNYNASEGTEPIFEARICLKGNQAAGRKITNSTELKEYLCDVMSSYATETFMVIPVDTQCRVLCTAIIGVGGIASVDADIASVAKVALLSNAHGVFLSHNHPGGTCYPSSEDISSTLRIKKALELFGIIVFDHLIVCPDKSTYSMARHGDIY